MCVCVRCAATLRQQQLSLATKMQQSNERLEYCLCRAADAEDPGVQRYAWPCVQRFWKAHWWRVRGCDRQLNMCSSKKQITRVVRLPFTCFLGTDLAECTCAQLLFPWIAVLLYLRRSILIFKGLQSTRLSAPTLRKWFRPASPRLMSWTPLHEAKRSRYFQLQVSKFTLTALSCWLLLGTCRFAKDAAQFFAEFWTGVGRSCFQIV